MRRKHRTFTEEQFRSAIAASSSIRQTLLALNLNPKGGGGYRSFYSAVKDFDVDTSHFTGQGWNKGKKFSPKRKLEDFLNNTYPIQSYKLKLRLIKEGVLPLICDSCGITEWLGQPAPLHLDHKDGNHSNNNLTNLRLVCPNCHALTPNYCGKNKGKANYS